MTDCRIDHRISNVTNLHRIPNYNLMTFFKKNHCFKAITFQHFKIQLAAFPYTDIKNPFNLKWNFMADEY